ncbi:MAG: tetratricopeptide repeat protein [Acidobacteriaceae bacterium]
MKGLSLFFSAVFLSAPAFARDSTPVWVEVRSPHFIVMTDSNAKQAAHIAEQFERMRAVLHTLFPGAKVDPPAPILVLALKDQKGFKALEPAAYLAKGQLNLAGYFQPGPEKNYILMRLDGGQEHPFATVYHEYTHFAFSGAAEWMPLWLNEGIAEFFQNTDIHDKEVALGQPSQDDVLYLRQNRIIPLSILFAVDHNSPYYHEENKGSVFYAESWALVHYLEVSGQQSHQDRIATYAKLLVQKQDPVSAATAAFGDLNKLQRDLEMYIRESSFRYFRIATPPAPDIASFETSAVSPADADARRAEFLAYNGRTAEAHTLLDNVLKQDPNNAVACETLGYMALHTQDMEGARKWLTQAVKLDSHSYLAHYYYASMAMSEDSLKDAPAIEASLKTAIKLNPAFAPSYDRLASLYRMQHEHLEEAHMLELQASELEPANLFYRINAAHLLAALNRESDALHVLEAARPLAKDPSQTAMLDQSIRAIEQSQSMRAEQAQHPGNQAQRMERFKTAVIETSSAASPHPSATADATKRNARGIIQAVHCNGAVLELELQGAANTIALYSNNYFKIEFVAVNDASPGDMQPCQDLEGKPAVVSYAETVDSTAAGEIVSITIGGSQVSDHLAASATAPKREARGVLRGIRCGPPSVLELEVDGAAKKLALYAPDYYKISFLATNYQPEGEIHPCTDLEGKHAIVLYAATEDKTAAGQILSIALSR